MNQNCQISQNTAKPVIGARLRNARYNDEVKMNWRPQTATHDIGAHKYQRGLVVADFQNVG